MPTKAQTLFSPGGRRTVPGAPPIFLGSKEAVTTGARRETGGGGGFELQMVTLLKDGDDPGNGSSSRPGLGKFLKDTGRHFC